MDKNTVSLVVSKEQLKKAIDELDWYFVDDAGCTSDLCIRIAYDRIRSQIAHDMGILFNNLEWERYKND